MNRATQVSILVMALLTAGGVCHRPPSANIANSAATRRVVFSAVQTDGFFLRLQMCEPVPLDSVTATWTPTEQDVRDLDSRLALVLRDSLRSSEMLSPTDYLFQYFGVVTSGKRLIFINAFHRAVAQSASDTPDEWRRTPLQMCDAGKGAFQATYSVDTKNLSPLHFFSTLGTPNNP